MKMIVGKRQIVLAALVVALGVAIYLNASFAKSGEEYLVADTMTGQQDEESSGDHYGDAQLVANQTASSLSNASKSMSEARLKPPKSRDEAMETLETMLSNADIGDEDKQIVLDKAADVALSIETEGRIENLIKAKGFADCMAYLSDGQVQVVVQTNGLSMSEAAQIKDIVMREADVKAENVSIVEAK